MIDDSDDVSEMGKILEQVKKHYSDTYEYRRVKTGEIAPTDTAPVIIPNRELIIDVVPMRWGYEGITNSGIIFNARSESLFERPMFKKSARERRCVIPTNGFYEWRKLPDGNKQKYLIRGGTDSVLYLAGIYDIYTDKITRKRNVRFVIVTREAVGTMRALHHRMPVHVEKWDISKWLNGDIRSSSELFTARVPDYTFTNLSAM